MDRIKTDYMSAMNDRLCAEANEKFEKAREFLQIRAESLVTLPSYPFLNSPPEHVSTSNNFFETWESQQNNTVAHLAGFHLSNLAFADSSSWCCDPSEPELATSALQVTRSTLTDLPPTNASHLAVTLFGSCNQGTTHAAECHQGCVHCSMEGRQVPNVNH